MLTIGKQYKHLTRGFITIVNQYTSEGVKLVTYKDATGYSNTCPLTTSRKSLC